MRLDAGNHRRRNEVAVRVSIDLDIATIKINRAAFRCALGDQAFDTRFGVFGNDRADISARNDASIDLQRLCLFDDVGNPVGSLTHQHRDRGRHAALSGGTKASTDERVERLIFVRVGHHDGVVFCAHHALRALTVIR